MQHGLRAGVANHYSAAWVTERMLLGDTMMLNADALATDPRGLARLRAVLATDPDYRRRWSAALLRPSFAPALPSPARLRVGQPLACRD